MAKVAVREACIEDCEEIFRLSMELMEMENIAHRFKGTIDSFRRDGFGSKRRFTCIVAEDQNLSKSSEKDHPQLAGILLYTWMYKAGQYGHVMHVEMLYITETNRRQGIGTALLQKALQIAAGEQLLRVQLMVQNSNTVAMDFYKKTSAINATESLGWNIVRVFEDKIKEHVGRLDESQSMRQGNMTGGDPAVSGVMNVREACVGDCGEIFRLMKEMAVFKDEAHRFQTDIENIKRNGFGDNRNFQCIVAEDKDCTKPENPKLTAFLVYTWIYKAWLGSYTMYVEDIFVSEEYRGKGLGKTLFEHAIKTAKLKGYNSIQVTVRKSNTAALNFYKKFGAVNVTEDRGMNFIIFRTM